jgi:hypothetical protein
MSFVQLDAILKGGIVQFVEVLVTERLVDSAQYCILKLLQETD